MDAEISKYAGLYSKVFILAMFFLSQYDCNKVYLNAMRLTYIPMLFLMTTTTLHFIYCYILVNVCDLDVLGVSLATCLSYFSNFLISMIYCCLKNDLKSSFFWPTKETF
jgi:Na+-driven multidrug efflux pump